MPFHYSALIFQPGDRILPGSWGRRILSDGPSHEFFYREQVWESSRADAFTERPSRMASAYAFEDFAIACKFANDSSTPHYVYSVKVAGTPFKADMGWITAARDARSFDEVDHCIRSYWRGEMRIPACVELLSTRPLVVVERLICA